MCNCNLYSKIDSNLNFVEREAQVLEFWKENKIFEKSISIRENSDVFTFYDGPPTANGLPHIGHVLTRSVKDIIPRYKTMKGYKVLRKAGWDTHGLPVELEIEKNLKISGKPQIESYGVEPFIQKCKESVFTYESLWKKMSDQVGFWADMENPYVTYHNEYIESVWWALKEIWDKGLLYKGHKVVPYCSRCGTSLSSHEVAQGYKDIKDTTATVKFKVSNTSNEFFLAWTTTPWTLPSNIALTVNAKEQYVKVKVLDEIYILAKELIKNNFENEDEVQILETFLGESLKGISYEPLFDYAKDSLNGKKAFYVVCDDYVNLSDGTGIVHTAPGFGEDDARVGRENDLPFIQFVDEQGKMTKETKDLSGKFFKDADIEVIKKLKAENRLFKAQKHSHNYPFCWRCDTPLMYYARDTWFIAMTKVRDKLVANNQTVNWMPENVKDGRFGNFLQNVVDWGLSRERYWGTPLPIWECECGHKDIVGSIAQLKEMSSDCPENIELHKPYIDNVHLNCPKCNGKMKRVSEVIDCWFDSGCMPFAQWHYPFENKEIFEKNFPADFISEAIDQTRGWFYTLIAISTLLFDKAPYKNVIVLGHVQDKDGKKMSKSKGNAVSPEDVLNKQGADAVRWYFFTNSSPWLPNRFYDEAINESQRKFMGTLWNTYAFYVLYANIDNFNPKDYTLDLDKLSVMDKWVLSKLNSLIKFVDNGLEEYKLTETSRAIVEFTDELSNWYVRRCRERFWAKGMEQDKINAYMTLYTVLVNLIKISAPYTPFITETIYQNLVFNLDKNSPESVHLCDFPKADDKFINKELENDMDNILSVVIAGRAARNMSNIKNRQPIGNMYIKLDKGNFSNEFLEIIKDELNIKNIELKKDFSEFISYLFKPQLRTVGKKYGKIVPLISEYLKSSDGNKLMSELNQNSVIKFEVEGNKVELKEDDIIYEVKQTERFASETYKNISVAIDTMLTEELLEEGFVRELISKIQTMRKEANFEILDRILVYSTGNEKIAKIFEKNKEQIKEDVLADDIILNKSSDSNCKEWNINGENVTISVVKNN